MVQILKFRGKARVKFSRKFHKVFALRQRGICSYDSVAYLGLRPIKIKAPRQKRL